MGQVQIYGASDDLIEVEGAIHQEFSCWNLKDDEYRYLAFSDGTVIRVDFDKDGCWRFVRLARGSAEFTKTEATDPDGDYTDRVSLVGDIRWCVYGSEFERAAKSKGGAS
jgi:hypothetical protein